jgi:hypothetical protein
MRVAKKHSGGKLVSVMEGGYQLERQVLKKCVQAHMRALLTDDDFVSPSLPPEGYSSPISSSSVSSEYIAPGYSSNNHSRVQNATPYPSIPASNNYNTTTTSTNSSNNNYTTAQTTYPTHSTHPTPPTHPMYSTPSTNITKLSKSIDRSNNNTSPITIIDDPEQPTNNTKQTPAPKKGSIESILL